MSGYDWNDHLIGIDSKDLDNKIYRIMKVEELKALFKEGENVLWRPSPKEWDDPFEHLLLGANVRLYTGNVIPAPFKRCYFAQCWSKKGESDALWRIYSPEKGRVQVKTTIEKLIMGLCAFLPDKGIDRAFIGKVDYLTRRQIGELITKMGGVIDGPPKCRARALLIKRDSYMHEEEIRLIHEDCHESDCYKYAYKLSNVHDFVEEIVVDPRLNHDSATALIEELRTATSYSGTIRQSDLYQPYPSDWDFDLGF